MSTNQEKPLSADEIFRQMKKIELTGKYGAGRFALVDDEDYEYLNQWKWNAKKNHRSKDSYYAVRVAPSNGKYKPVSMHRVLLNITDPKILIDHIDLNGLNNQKNNLRKASRIQNGQNRLKLNRNGTTSSIHKGVCRFITKTRSVWRVNIRNNGTRIHLGDFENEIDAAKAYDKAAIKYFGEFANLNFPTQQLSQTKTDKG